jgi:hypothetical protein
MSVASAMTHDYRATRAFASGRRWVEAAMARVWARQVQQRGGDPHAQSRFTAVTGALASPAIADTGVGSLPGEESPTASGRGFGPTSDAGPRGPQALAAPAPPGDAGLGDPYFPLEGNGGYDVRHYDLTFSSDPATDRLDAVNAIRAVTSQKLSRFDLDLQQLDVSAVTVNGKPATFTRDGQELQITPKKPLPARERFDVSVTYGGVPQTIVGSPIVFGSPSASCTPTTVRSWTTSPMRRRRGSR